MKYYSLGVTIIGDDTSYNANDYYESFKEIFSGKTEIGIMLNFSQQICNTNKRLSDISNTKMVSCIWHEFI